MTKTEKIIKALRENQPIYRIAKNLKTSKMYVYHLKYREEARKYKALYNELLEKING